MPPPSRSSPSNPVTLSDQDNGEGDGDDNVDNVVDDDMMTIFETQSIREKTSLLVSL